jgi:peroxiredoxin
VPLLRAGDEFPPLDLVQVGGGRLPIPTALAGRYGVVLFSRGGRCRSCVEQLRAFHRGLPRLDDAGIGVVVLTADDEDTTAELVGEYGLTYPIGHSADVEQIAAATGAFVTVDPPQLQTTGFVLDPAGAVLISVYSCGVLGQLLPDDVLDLVREIREGVSDQERKRR